MSERRDETGHVFGLLTAERYVGGGKYRCRCECGARVYRDGHKLRVTKRRGGTSACALCDIARRKARAKL